MGPSALLVLIPIIGLPEKGARVETVEALLTRLSAETGSVIEADRALTGQPVFVDRRSMKAAEVLESVAFGLRASFVKTEKGLRITRTDEDKRQMRTDAQALWRERLRAWLAESDRAIAAAAALGDRRAQMAHYQRLLDDQLKRLQQPGGNAAITVTVNPSDLSPIGELYREIVRRIGIDKLATIGPEGRRIWSNQPATNQLACPDGNALLDAFERGQRETGAVNSAAPVRFTFAQLGGIQFQLRVYDSGGNLVGAYSGPPFSLNMAGNILLRYDQLAQPYGREATAWRSLGPSELEFNRFFGEKPVLVETPKQRLPVAMREPNRSDPLDYTVRVGLEEAARRTSGKGFVVIPTDELLPAASACVAGEKMNVDGFVHLLKERCQMEWKTRAGVAVVRGQDPFQAESRTVDRLRLADQVRSLLNRPSFRATDVAIAYYGISPSENSPMAKTIFDTLVRTQSRHRSSIPTMYGHSLAWIGAALTAKGTREGAVSIDPKNEPFRSLINRGVNSGLFRLESAERIPAAFMDAPAVVDSPQFNPHLVVETESAPLLGTLGVNPDKERDPRFQVYEPPERVGAVFGNMAAMHDSILYPGQADKMPTRDQIKAKIKTFGNYHLAGQDWIHVDFYPTPGLRARLSIQEIRVEKTNVSFDQLPESLRTRLLDGAMVAVTELFKRGSNTSGTGAPKTDPPPPR